MKPSLTSSLRYMKLTVTSLLRYVKLITLYETKCTIVNYIYAYPTFFVFLRKH